MSGSAMEQHIAASSQAVKPEAAWTSVQGEVKLNGR